MGRFFRRVTTVFGFLLLLLPAAAVACLWDYDTIRMERSRFPDTLELITGKFLRHSPEFYQWRITDRLQRLESDPTNAALLDDLAVAYDKVGEHDKAIETALKTEELHPGRYETASNLGTFYFHAGMPEQGLPYIERALQINPDAHFGREKYQLALTEYVLERREGDPAKLPLAEETHEESFAESLRSTSYQPLSPEENQAALKGVLGMMRFAKYDSPILLEALASLLTERHRPTVDAKQLAARAYLQASYAVPDGQVREAYRAMAKKALSGQVRSWIRIGVTLEHVENDFQQELTDAAAWYAALHERELGWIRDGKNPDKEFDRLYAADLQLSVVDVQTRRQLLIALLCLAAFVAFLVVWRRKKRTATLTASSA